MAGKIYAKPALELRYLGAPAAPLDMEFREDKTGLGKVSGVILRYGDVAGIGAFTEEFEAGAMKPYSGPIVANILHDRSRLLASRPGNMSLDFGAREVRAEFDLPDTADGREAVELIRMGVLASFSAEFRVDKDTWDGQHRTIQAATLYGLGLVAQPAYPASQVDRALAQIDHDLVRPHSGAGKLQANADGLSRAQLYRRNLLRGML